MNRKYCFDHYIFEFRFSCVSDEFVFVFPQVSEEKGPASDYGGEELTGAGSSHIMNLVLITRLHKKEKEEMHISITVLFISFS